MAIAGNDEAAEQMLGTGSRLEDMLLAISEGEPFGHFTFVAEESYSQGVKARLVQVAHIPDIPPGAAADDWCPMDMLVAQVRDERGDLRALLYLDEPLGLKRLNADRLMALLDTLAMPLRSVITVIEREEFAHHIRVIGATRRLARSSPARHDVAHLLREARLTLLDALSVDALEIHLFGIDDPDHDVLGLGLPPDVRRSLDTAAQEAWADQRVLIIEPGHVWGNRALHTSHAPWFTRALSEAGFAAVVVAPVGVDDQLLGMLMVARRAGSRRWTDGEGVAALELGHDLGRAIANAHATERERRLLEELRQLEASRHEFLRVLTHEINNPMTVISANAEYLLSLDELEQGDRRRASAILRGTKQLGSLLDDLVLLSRASDPEHPPMESFDLTVQVEETLAAMMAVAERADVRLRMLGERAVFTVVGERREIAGAVANLVDNAAKYSDAGGQVWLDLERDTDGGVRFTCRDEGLGISDLDQRRLFNPLFRSTNEEAIRRPGTGLGLGIVREIMRRHGGLVEIESVLGAGTTASLRFPPPLPA